MSMYRQVLQQDLASFMAGLEPTLVSQFRVTIWESLKTFLSHTMKKTRRRYSRVHILLVVMIQLLTVIKGSFLDTLTFLWGPMKYLLSTTEYRLPTPFAIIIVVGWIRSAITHINQKSGSLTRFLQVIIPRETGAMLRPHDSTCGSHELEYISPNSTQRASSHSSMRQATLPVVLPKISVVEAKDIKVGIICALPLELFAVRALFDEIHPRLRPPHNDPNTYCLGTICHHKVVAACLPAGEYGTNSAADVASNMKRSFPALRFCLLVGIGGGVPTKEDIRLGDVVVSKRIGQSPAVMQYDMEKALGSGISQQIGYLNLPPRELMTALSNLQSDPFLPKTPLQEYLDVIASFNSDYRYPGTEFDRLFSSSSIHIDGYDNCDSCDPSYLHFRSSRPDTHPRIHYGLIASANKVIRDAAIRDQWSGDTNVLCFEMEAAGVVNTIPCLVIRGICDYSDCHKNKRFQNYAAASAASFAKLLLSYVM